MVEDLIKAYLAQYEADTTILAMRAPGTLPSMVASRRAMALVSTVPCALKGMIHIVDAQAIQ
jgi:hypothetical protein